MPFTYPTETELRALMVRRVDLFCRLRGVSRAAVCKSAMRDPAFLTSKVMAGKNFRVARYTRLMEWLDANWPDQDVIRREALLAAANYCANAGITMERLGVDALGDDHFVAKVVGCEPIDVEAFERLWHWIEGHPVSRAAPADRRPFAETDDVPRPESTAA